MIIRYIVAGTLLVKQMWVSNLKLLPEGHCMHMFLLKSNKGRSPSQFMQLFTLLS
jgi:hypothetical protein